jgi:hypothetical protein
MSDRLAEVIKKIKQSEFQSHWLSDEGIPDEQAR